MLRLKTPGRTRLLQQPALEATWGGSEANTAAGLSAWGIPAAFGTVLPDNSLGHQCRQELSRRDINVDRVLTGPGRMGLYFVEAGADVRPSQVLYDREGSALARAALNDIDPSAILEGISWFHISGITPALSPEAAEVSLGLLQEAARRDITISLDINYRSRLWKYGKRPQDVLPPMLDMVHYLFANEEDFYQAVLEDSSSWDRTQLQSDRYRPLAEEAFSRFSQLKGVAFTLRESFSAHRNGWSALFHDSRDLYQSRRYDISPVIDRIGAGDTFSAGMIRGLWEGEPPQTALDWAAAASTLAHSVPGDFPLISRREVDRLAGGDSSGRVRR